MMKKLLLAIALIVGALFASPALVSAQASSTSGAKESVCQGVGITGGTCDDGGTTIETTIKTVIKVLSFIIGIIAVIMIIIGGLKYITSGGESSSINSAKNTILFAVVGLVVVLLAQVLVRFVISRVG